MPNEQSDFEKWFANAPIEINAKGAKQSKLDYRYDGLSPTAMRRLAHVRWYGMQRYPEHNWKGISAREHMNRALHHIFSWLDGDTSEDHAGHAFCRLMFAVDLEQNAPITQDQIGEECR